MSKIPYNVLSEKRIKVFIDPGHGGSDPGAVGSKSKEAENVLAVALALEKKLKTQGYDVKLSRRTNVSVSLNDRAKMANNWGADIFLSLHDNSAVNKTATGFETFVFNGSNVSPNSIKLQQHVHKSIIIGIGLRDRGMKRANFAVVRLTNMPALLIEYGFISNLYDEKIIAFEIEKQAQLTFVGINNYFGVKTTTPNPVAPKDNQKHFINTVKNHIADCWTKYRILPSMVMAQAILESGWGTSDKAIKANNLFGIKANSDWKGATVTLPTKEYVNGKWITIDAKWRKYNSWGESIVDHAAFLSKSRYKSLIGNTDYKSVCQELQKAGYATDPAYASKLISIIEANNLSQFDNFDKEEEKVYSSGTLKAEHDITRESAARRKIIVEAAIKAGYNEIWREKLEDGTITADDVDALATGTIVKNHK